MKRLLLILTLACPVMFSSCLKGNSCKLKSVQEETPTMQAYATAHGITAIQYSSGIMAEIVTAGSGSVVTSSSKVSVTYIGKLLDGTVFDQATTPTTLYPLTAFIAGWQVAIPLLKKGGSMKVLIPSSLGYGCDGTGPIPGNAVLYFEITLVDVQ